MDTYNNMDRDTGYQNVGSSGTNTANTANTDYSTPSSEGGYDYSGCYTSGSSGQPRPQKPRGRFPWAKVGKGALALVLAAAVGFGGGYCGALVAGMNQPQVVTQTVERPQLPAGTAATEGDLTAVAAAISPSVVAITTESMVTSNYWFGGQYVQSGAGSGVVFSEDGYILTCNHVVSGASNIKVSTSDGTEYTATMVGGDSQTDIAVLKIEASGLIPAVIGDSDALAVGEVAIAVGNPLGHLGGTVTNGIVSALNRNITVENQSMTLIQTNAAISPGNSGGGLFNGAGELIGITNAKSGSNVNAEGITFAIPINTAYQVAQDLIGSGYVTGRPVMGVSLITVSSAEEAMRYGVNGLGVYVAVVNEGSGAEKAGVQVGDRVVSIDDVLVESSSDVTGQIQTKSVGDTVTLQLARGGKLLTVEVTLSESVPEKAPSVEG